MPTGVRISNKEKVEMAKAGIQARIDGKFVKDTSASMGIHPSQLGRYIKQYKAGEYDELPGALMEAATEVFNVINEPEQISVTVYDKKDNKKSIEIVVDKPETDSITEYKKELHASVKARLGIILEGEDFE